MVLATILQCAVMFNPVDEPNAADSWNEYFQELELVEFPWDYDYEWTVEAQTRYEELAPFIQRAHEIASIEHCDWEIDYSQGIDTLIPHVGNLHKAQRILQFSMYGDIKNGNTSSAIEHMSAMLDVTRHQNNTKLIIGSLVSAKSFSMAVENEHLIDSANDASQLEAMLEKTNSLDAFDPFNLRKNVGDEGEFIADWLKGTENPDFDIYETITNIDVDTTGWIMEEEIETYSSMMKKTAAVFQMEDEEEATKAALELIQEANEIGKLTELLYVSTDKLIGAAFNNAREVAQFKELLQTKIDMLRNPNSATYFLKATEAYNDINSEERLNAIQHGDFTLLEEPFKLFAKACSMPPKKITLANSPETPHWIAPLYSLALDCISRGTTADRLAIMEFVGHLSQQDRFAASILAAKLFDYDWGSTPEPDEPHLQVAFERAKKQIPSADEFMLHGSAESERQRLLVWYDIEESWDPNDTNTLAMTLTLAKLKGVDQYNPEAWTRFIKAVGLPDMHPSFLFAEEEYNPELIEFLKLPQEDSFDEKLQQFRTLIGRDRYSETNSRGR